MVSPRQVGTISLGLTVFAIVLLLGFSLLGGELTALNLTLTLVISVTVLIAVLVLSSWILKCANLSNPNEALGLPTGSVRAIIALALILIFSILSVFMFQLLTEPQTTTTITTQSFSNVTEGNLTITNSTQIIKGTSADVIDFSKQMLTTISTLVVAIAAFYFGTRSVARAQGSKEEAELFISPSGDVSAPAGAPLTIVVKPTPEDADYVLKIDPSSENNSIDRSNLSRLIYTPSAGVKGKVVTLTFTMPKYEDVDQQELKITVK